MNKKNLIPIIFCLVLTSVIFQVSCSQTQIERFTDNLKKAIEVFKEQRSETEEALREAEKARIRAMEQKVMEFTSSKSQKFIEKWREADVETRNLRTTFNNVIESADFFFAYCEKKSKTIKDPSLLGRMAEVIQRKKDAFAQKTKKSHGALNALEQAIVKGNDIITSMEIVSGLKAVGEKFDELGDIYKSATEKLPETESLIKEGMQLLESDLSTLKWD